LEKDLAVRYRVAYRIAENEWNIKDPPWRDAVGIEEVFYWDNGPEEMFGVPPLVMWLTRGRNQREFAERIVALLNSDQEWLDECAKHPG
jgi:hypothetical protein